VQVLFPAGKRREESMNQKVIPVRPIYRLDGATRSLLATHRNLKNVRHIDRRCSDHMTFVVNCRHPSSVILRSCREWQNRDLAPIAISHEAAISGFPNQEAGVVHPVNFERAHHLALTIDQ